jgi:hypothetical protein
VQGLLLWPTPYTYITLQAIKHRLHLHTEDGGDMLI